MVSSIQKSFFYPNGPFAWILIHRAIRKIRKFEQKTIFDASYREMFKLLELDLLN